MKQACSKIYAVYLFYLGQFECLSGRNSLGYSTVSKKLYSSMSYRKLLLISIHPQIIDLSNPSSSLGASSLGHSGSGLGKGRRACNHVSGTTGVLEMGFKFQRHSCKLSFLFLPHRQSTPESLHAG